MARLWVSAASLPALRRPASLPEEWDDDPALLRCNGEGFKSRFSHLVRNVELWLPQAFDFVVEGDDVDGRRVVLSGTRGGFVDLFLLTLESGRLEPLTKDPFADLERVEPGESPAMK